MKQRTVHLRDLKPGDIELIDDLTEPSYWHREFIQFEILAIECDSNGVYTTTNRSVRFGRVGVTTHHISDYVRIVDTRGVC